MPILSVERVTKAFGGLAVASMSAWTMEGELVSLRSQRCWYHLFNLLTGIYVPDSGTINLSIDNQRILLMLRPHSICQKGQDVSEHSSVQGSDGFGECSYCHAPNIKYGLLTSFCIFRHIKGKRRSCFRIA